MTRRGQLSRDRLYRYLSVCLALATALMLIPADWIHLTRKPEKPREPQARVVQIVRVPPETLPPPPPLPPRPKPKPKPKPPKPIEPPKVEEIVKLKPIMDEPEIVIPQEQREIERKLDLRAEQITRIFERNTEVPEVDLPKQRQRDRHKARMIADTRPSELNVQQDAVEVTVPKNVPRQSQAREIQVAAATTQSFLDKQAPDVGVVTPRPAARAADRPSLLPVSQQLRTGTAIRKAANAPAVDIPRGNTARKGHAVPIAVSGAVTGTRVVYDQNPGSAREVAVASPSRARRAGAAPQLAATRGGSAGLKYSSAPTDVSIGGNNASRRSSGSTGKLEAVRSALASKYGIPLISLNAMGQRSTEAARWNILLPQIADLLRASRGKGSWRGGPGDEVVSVTRDGKNFIIRYRDGVLHVLVPTGDGLATFFVGRAKGARKVTSKVQEAEQAIPALNKYIRGAS